MLNDEIKEIRNILGLDKKLTKQATLKLESNYVDAGLGNTESWEHIQESEINFKIALSHNYGQNAFF